MIRVCVEAERGSRRKFSFDHNLRRTGVRETLLPYPYPYGFILGTVADDGEGLDCYILTDERLNAGSVVECEPAGILDMTENDEKDCKILAVLPGNPAVVGPGVNQELREFITGIFRKFPDVQVTVGSVRSREEAIDRIERETAREG